MITVTINKTTQTGTCTFEGKEYNLKLQFVNKESVKPGTYWLNMKPLGTPKMWSTINFNNYDTDIFDVEIDETAHRVVTPRVSRVVGLGNIKDFLTEERAELFDELYAEAVAEAKRRADEAEANKPVKEKKSRKMTLEEKIAKLEEEAAKYKKAQEEGKLYVADIEPPKAKKTKQAVIEDLDAEDETADVAAATLADLDDNGAF